MLVCNKTEEGTEKTSEEKFEFTQIPNQIITFKKKNKTVHFILKKKKEQPYVVPALNPQKQIK